MNIGYTVIYYLNEYYKCFIQADLDRKYFFLVYQSWYDIKIGILLTAPTPSSGCSHVCNKLEKSHIYALKRAIATFIFLVLLKLIYFSDGPRVLIPPTK